MTSSKENYTRLLVLRGSFEYYEEIILFRAGLASEKKISTVFSAMASVYGQSAGISPWQHRFG